MDYYIVKLYPDGRVVKENITEEDSRGYLKAGMFYHCGSEEYNFFVDEEKMIQKQYDKYRKRKLKEYCKEIQRLQKCIKSLEKPVII